MKPKDPKKLEVISFRTSEATKKKLIAEARKRKVTLSELIDGIVAEVRQ